MTQRFLMLSSCLVGFVGAACGSHAPTPTTAQSTETTPAAPAKWSDDLSMDQKMAFMKVSVAPRMAKVFQGKDAADYADFGCKSCHGPDGKDPKEYLPKLAMKDGKITAFADEPEVAKFMAEKVVPEMASVFGQAPYDPATKTGFGCMGCHQVETK